MLWCSLTIVVVFLSSTIDGETVRLSYTIASKTIHSTECATDCINNLCYTDVYRRYTESCSPGTEAAPQYRTVQYKGSTPYCTGRCGKYGYNYDWCYTGDTINDDTWDYCSAKTDYNNKQIRHITKDNSFCASDCDYHNYYYTWCYTVDRSWGMCNKSHKKPYLQSYTYKGEKCLGMCHEQHHSYNWCYTDRHKNWDYCAPPAKTKSSLVNHNSMCRVSTINTSTRRLEKRATSDNDASHRSIDDTFWRNLLQNLPIPNSDIPGNYLFESVNTPESAIRGYLIYNENVLGYTVPIGVRAIISHNTLTSCRDSTPYAVSHRNIPLLDPAPDDDIGHIIASCNGGPAAIYNLVPQNRAVNRGGEWREIERNINTFVRNTDNYVLQNVIISYNGTEDPQWPGNYTLRPLGFYISLSYYYGNNTIQSNTNCFINN